MVSDKYEKSYSLLKSIENPEIPRSEAEFVCEIQGFDGNLSKNDPKIFQKIENIVAKSKPTEIRAFRSILRLN